MTEITMPYNAACWVVGGDTGLSSVAIFAHMTGVGDPYHGYCYPLDPSDFGRCHRLLLLVPEWRARMPEMAGHGPVWARMAHAWGEMTALWEEECAHPHPLPGTRAPRLYEMMKRLEQEARQ